MQRQHDGIAAVDADEARLGAEMVANLLATGQPDRRNFRVGRGLGDDAAGGVDNRGARAVERPATVEQFAQLRQRDRGADEADAARPVANGLERTQHRHAGEAAAFDIARW